MSDYAVSFEATTPICCSRSEVDEISDDHAIGGKAASDLFESLRDLAPSNVKGIVEAYATGSTEDFDDGEVTAFVRVTLLMSDIEESEDEPTAPKKLLDAVYLALKLPDSIDAPFEYVEDEAVEEFVPFVPTAGPKAKL